VADTQILRLQLPRAFIAMPDMGAFAAPIGRTGVCLMIIIVVAPMAPVDNLAGPVRRLEAVLQANSANSGQCGPALGV
jgi:hypothetical protein